MNLRCHLFVYLIAFFCITACSNPQNSEGENSTEASSNQPQSAKEGCYHSIEKNWEERLNIAVSDDRISGSGYRINQQFNDRFQLDIQGKKMKDGNYDVEVICQSKRRTNEKETQYETWSFQGNSLKIINRNTKDFIGDLSLQKVNCGANSTKDPELYDEFLGYNEGYAVVAKDGKYGLVNKEGQLTIPCAYMALGAVSEGTIMYYDEQKGRHGILDVNGNILIEPIYDVITPLGQGLLGFVYEGKWGFLNKKGEIVIAPKFFNVNFFQPNPLERPFNEGLANVAIEDAKWGYINPKGEVVIPYQFMFAGPFRGGKAKVMRQGENKWIYIDKSGQCVENCN